MSKLKKLRQECGYSQSKLSEASGINVRMIQQYEQGVRNINTAQVITVLKLAEALNVKIEDLLEPE